MLLSSSYSKDGVLNVELLSFWWQFVTFGLRLVFLFLFGGVLMLS